MIESKLRQLRVLTRANSKLVVDYLVRNFIDRSPKPKYDRYKCFICGVSSNMTKEHVLPQWVFGANPQKFFVTGMNGISQTYMKTTVPACANCNNNLLSSLDSFVCTALKRVNIKDDFFEQSEFEGILRWLELIDYKFQVLNFMRKFLKPNKGDFIPYLADFPITMIRDQGKSDRDVISELRRSRKRISIKDKYRHYNSLIFIGTKSDNFTFFHQMDEYIFIQFGVYKKALFYFYEREFDTVEEATLEARKIVEQNLPP